MFLSDTDMAICKIHDGVVRVESGNLVYVDSAENFELDSEGPFPDLPPGDIGRTYFPGERHFTSTGKKSTQHPIPWVDGDIILANLAGIIASKVLREEPGPPPSDDVILAELEKLSKALKAFLLLYGEREGFTPAQVRNAIITKMGTL
jgi:hypothetical protein